MEKQITINKQSFPIKQRGVAESEKKIKKFSKST